MAGDYTSFLPAIFLDCRSAPQWAPSIQIVIHYEVVVLRRLTRDRAVTRDIKQLIIKVEAAFERQTKVMQNRKCSQPSIASLIGHDATPASLRPSSV